jgi:O-antigen ligase
VKKFTSGMESTERFPVRWIYGSLIATTLYFNPALTDPFNSPKMWIVLLLAAWLSGYAISYRNLIFVNGPIKAYFFLLLAFAFSAIVATFFTEFKYVGIFGDSQRRNGLITYLALVVIGLAASIFIRLFNVKRVYFTTFAIGAVFAIYAYLQTTGRDFVTWNNPYNSIIGTVGNPNFASAVMSVMGVIIFSLIFVKGIHSAYRIASAALSAFLMFLIVASDSRQGILSFLIGAGLFCVVLLFNKNRVLGVISIFGGSIAAIFSILGMLQIGPLQELLYKRSVSVRGYYWRAGIEMFQQNPLMGVGMDRYGAYFNEYREVGYPLAYGFDITSSNAHNTFIQFFATGGFFLGITYLVLNGFILWRGITGVRKFAGNNRLLITGLLSAWVAFHSQSLISIDNIGVSIWGWVLGGSIIGLSVSNLESSAEDQKQFQRKKNDINLKRVFTSSSFTALILILVSLLYRGEVNTFKASVRFDAQNQVTRESFRQLQIDAINTPLNDPNNSLNRAIALVQSGFVDEGIEAAINIHKRDPRNLAALEALALLTGDLNKKSEALTYHLKIAELDPWDAVNYLAIGKIYKAQGNLAESAAMLSKILSFASSDPIAAQAKAELSP